MLVCQSISHISNSLAIVEYRVYVAVGCGSNYKKSFFSVHIVAKLYTCMKVKMMMVMTRMMMNNNDI